MGYASDQKERSRRAILDAAGRRFRRHGYLGAGIDGVMAEAGLTAGAFYRHFASKEELLREVLRDALHEPPPQREQGLEALAGAQWVAGLIGNYLSQGHLEAVEMGCPLPALTPELARSNDAARAAFAEGLEVWKRQLAARLREDDEEPTEAPRPRADGGPEMARTAQLAADAATGDVAAERDELALGLIAAMVGGMTLARALVHDPQNVILDEPSAQGPAAGAQAPDPCPEASPGTAEERSGKGSEDDRSSTRSTT